MKNTKHVISLLMCMLLLLGSAVITACSGDKPDTNQKVTASVDDIYTAVSAVMPSADTLIDAQPSYLSLFFDGAKAEDFASYKIVMQSMSTSIDTVGIFEAKELSEVKTLETMVDAYFDYYENEVWDDTYLEGELPKLQNAQRVTAGQYVLFVIADDATRAAVITAFENATK